MKQVPVITPAEAAGLVRDGAVLMAGGFGMTGNPVHLLHALAESGVRGLTYVGNNVGEPGLGGGDPWNLLHVVSRFGGWSRDAYCSSSMTAASPCPTPTHSVASPWRMRSPASARRRIS